jgi:putative transposase
MEHWVFGARCRKNMARYHNNVALVHKTANILDKMPKSVQGRAKELIHEMYLSPTRKAALEAYDQFIASYQAKYPKATDCLEKDKEWLFTFYDFPAQHWSIFGRPTPLNRSGRCRTTVRLRTPANQRLGSRIATLTMVFNSVSKPRNIGADSTDPLCSQKWSPASHLSDGEELQEGVSARNGQ